jgi:Undecaprenyl-phosphate galactose phosphotransferase WbaP
VFFLLLTWDYMVQGHQWSRGIMLGTAVFALVLPPIFEEIARHALGKWGLFGVPVLMLGGNVTGAHVIRHLRSNPGLGYRPTVILDEDPAKQGTVIEGVTVVGPFRMAAEFQGSIRSCILTVPGMDQGRVAALIESLPFSQVILVPDALSSQTLWITARDLGGILGLEINRNLLSPVNHALKRLMDLLISVPLFVLCLPVLGVCGVLIKIFSPGPIFYSQVRHGKRSRPLRMLKLRTMRPDAEFALLQYLAVNPDEADGWKRYFKLRRDPRIIPLIGGVLRRFSLDELPQLWHVIKGEMSLVGPRPFPQYHLDAFPAEFRRLRATVTPGLTGLWQVSVRSDGDVSIQQEIDNHYIQNWSPWLDLHILVKTVRVVLMGRGAY